MWQWVLLTFSKWRVRLSEHFFKVTGYYFPISFFFFFSTVELKSMSKWNLCKSSFHKTSKTELIWLMSWRENQSPSLNPHHFSVTSSPWSALRIPWISWEHSWRITELERQIWYSSVTCQTIHLFISTTANQLTVRVEDSRFINLNEPRILPGKQAGQQLQRSGACVTTDRRGCRDSRTQLTEEEKGLSRLEVTDLVLEG